MNIIPHIYSKLSLFTAAERVSILQMLSHSGFRNQTTLIQAAFQEMFSLLTALSTTYEKQTLLDFLRKASLEATEPEIYITYTGEDFCFKIALDEDTDFTGFFLVAREAEDLTALSALNIAGDSYANAPEQEVVVQDLTLVAGKFYRVYINLENGTAGAANGNATALLVEAVLIVRANIDAA